MRISCYATHIVLYTAHCATHRTSQGGEAGEPKEQGAAGIADWSLGSNQVDAVGAGARKPCGRVVGILRRAWRSRGYCGSLLAPDRVGGSQSLLFLPVDRRIPKVRACCVGQGQRGLFSKQHGLMCACSDGDAMVCHMGRAPQHTQHPCLKSII